MRRPPAASSYAGLPAVRCSRWCNGCACGGRLWGELSERYKDALQGATSPAEAASLAVRWKGFLCMQRRPDSVFAARLQHCMLTRQLPPRVPGGNLAYGSMAAFH